MTHQTNTESASLVAVTASEGLVGVWCCGCTVLPLSCLLYKGPTVGFKRGGSVANGVSPCASVCGKCRLLKMAEQAGKH